MPERLMRLKEVAAYFSMNQRTIRRLCDRGEFPKPIRLGKSIRWREQSLVDFINGMVKQGCDDGAERDA